MFIFLNMCFINMFMIMMLMLFASSSNWIIILLSMEMIMYSLISSQSFKTKNQSQSSSIMTYFLIQALSTIILLVSIMISMNYTWKNYQELMLMISMIMKMGAFPFQFWVPLIMEYLSYHGCFILMTLSKVIPLFMISEVNNQLVYWSAFFSCMIGCLEMLNQNSLKKILAFSSINHLGWLIMMTCLKTQMWNYFFMYLIMTMLMLKNLSETKIKYIYQTMINPKSQKFLLLFNIMVIFISISGIPPFMGFFMKMAALKTFMITKKLLFSLLILIMSTMSIFVYLKMCFSLLMMFKTEMKSMKMETLNVNSWVWILSLQMIILFSFLIMDLST